MDPTLFFILSIGERAKKGDKPVKLPAGKDDFQQELIKIIRNIIILNKSFNTPDDKRKISADI